jgi:hypothetical protein
MIKELLPWSLRGVGPFLNTYGDRLFFSNIKRTRPFTTNPDADTSVHSIVGHKYVYAYLVAIKSYLRFHSDVAAYIHDDGTLVDEDKQLIGNHIINVTILNRNEMRVRFAQAMNDPFLLRVRDSYTSYLKLFDPTFIVNGKRIMLLDTDTLFINRPDEIIDWAKSGGIPWYHMAPRGNMKKGRAAKSAKNAADQHIQTLIMAQLDDINNALNTCYKVVQGFCAGFVGYDVGTVDFDELKVLLEELYKRFGDRIFKWGAEQTIHGMILCCKGAVSLPLEEYFVFTQHNADQADSAKFVHFVGETRFYKMYYPRIASKIVSELKNKTRNI